jgi:hypothetical protein
MARQGSGRWKNRRWEDEKVGKKEVEKMGK